jgi:hypothetical protein
MIALFIICCKFFTAVHANSTVHCSRRPTMYHNKIYIRILQFTCYIRCMRLITMFGLSVKLALCVICVDQCFLSIDCVEWYFIFSHCCYDFAIAVLGSIYIAVRYRVIDATVGLCILQLITLVCLTLC